MMAGGRGRGNLLGWCEVFLVAQSSRPCKANACVYLGGEACGREACSWQRLVGQMVMRRKTGDRSGVGKKARPMGARLAHARKSKANPLALLWRFILGRGEGRGMGGAKAGAPFSRQIKRDQWVRGYRKQGQPTPLARCCWPGWSSWGWWAPLPRCWPQVCL